MNNLMIEKWLKEVIIGLNLCPFAKIPFEEGLVRISESKVTNEDEMRSFFLDELELILNKSRQELSTSLIVFSNYDEDFEQFNDFVGSCEYLLEEIKLDEHYQIVGFHPDFKFEGTQSNDRVNLVNSSPFPLIHIIRTEEISQVINSLTDGEKISFANEKKLKKIVNSDLEILFPWKFNT